MRFVRVLCVGALLLVIVACGTDVRQIGGIVTDVRSNANGCRFAARMDDGAVMIFTFKYGETSYGKCTLLQKDDRLKFTASFDARVKQIAGYFWEGSGAEYIPGQELK